MLAHLFHRAQRLAARADQQALAQYEMQPANFFLAARKRMLAGVYAALVAPVHEYAESRIAFQVQADVGVMRDQGFRCHLRQVELGNGLGRACIAGVVVQPQPDMLLPRLRQAISIQVVGIQWLCDSRVVERIRPD